MPLQLADLLGKGYFPKELPPPFTTQSYSQALTGPVGVPGAFNSPQRFSPSAVHNLVRTGGLRRNLLIPNPKHFVRLASHVATEWAQYETFTHQSPFSLTKPVHTGDRAISPEHDLNMRTTFRAALRARGKYLLRTDVSRFFPSIYTHSLPWAGMGKAAAKAAYLANTLAGTWLDKGDMLTRGIMNNQTVGIPIGPDTSRLFAEMILTRVDIELGSAFPRLHGLRYIDDYEFICPTRAEAEAVLCALQHELNEFELALNPSKTAIIELPEPLDNPWASRLRTFVFRSHGTAGQKHEITAYVDEAFQLAKLYPEEGLLKYAVARLRSEEIAEVNWDYVESILSHCVMVEPACLPQVCEQIIYYRSEGYSTDKQMWSECLNRIICECVPLGYSSEAAWAMWLLKVLKIRLSAKATKIVGQTNDVVVGLMGLGLAATGLAMAKHLTDLHRFNSPAEVLGPQWMLCYEGNMHSWLGPASSVANLNHDAAIAHLAHQNVTFFDINVAPTVPAIPVYAALGGGGGGGVY